jgi:hypothetical protein
VGTATGVPAVQRTNTIYFNLIIPSRLEPAGGWPVAIFGHGFGDNKNNSGDGTPGLSTSRIYYFGQSVGGIYGTELMGLDPLVHTGVLNVPGGPIIEIARLSPAFRPLVEQSLGSRRPSLLNGGFDGFTEDIPLRNQPPVTQPVAGSLPIQEFIDHTEWASQTKPRQRLRS